MHTYRKVQFGGWQVGHQQPNEFYPLGPILSTECEAAAFACFLNGGRYSPGEIADVFTLPPDGEENWDEPAKPDRPADLDDYPLERKRG